MPKYTLEIGGKTYEIESDRPLSDSDLATYAQKIVAPQQTQPSAPPGQIPGAGPYVAPAAEQMPVGRRIAQGMQRNVGQITGALPSALQPTAEMLAGAAGAARGATAMAPGGPVSAALGGLAGGLAGFAGARAGGELLQGQTPDMVDATTEYLTGETLVRGAGKIFTGGARALDFLRFTPERQAANIARQAAGEVGVDRTKRLPAISEALRVAEPGVSPAQATAEIPRQPWQALLAFEPTDFSAQLARNRRALQEEELARMAGGRSQTEAMRTQEQSQQMLNALTAPIRQTELGAANQAAETIARLGPQAQARQQSMISALRQGQPMPVPAPQQGGLVRGTVTGEPMTGQSMIVPSAEAARLRTLASQAQGPMLRPDQVGAVGQGQEARFLRNRLSAAADEQQQTGQVFAEIAQQRRAERDFIERQIGSLEAYGLRPLDVTPIVQSIEASIKAPGIAASPTTVKVLRALSDDFANLAALRGGTMDVHDLYTLRKEGIAQRIQDILGQQDPKIGAKITSSVLQQLKPLIDQAIERAGGTGWTRYLETYSQGMDVIAQKQMAAQALEMFKDSPQQFVKLVRGNNPDAVEAIFGPGRYDIFKEMSSQMPTLDKLARQVELDKKALEQAGLGKAEFAAILEANRSKLRLPGWFNPQITAANLGLSNVNKRLDKKTVELLRKAAETNQSMLDLLNGLPEKERRKLLDIVIEKQRVTLPAKAAATAATIGEADRQANTLAPQPLNALTAP